jgi:hypothetical protein
MLVASAHPQQTVESFSARIRMRIHALASLEDHQSAMVDT